MARQKFTFKRLRMDLDENAFEESDGFDFESEEEDEIETQTVSALAAVEIPGRNFTVANAQERVVSDGKASMQPTGKRERGTGPWELQGQRKKQRIEPEDDQNSVGTGTKPWGSWLDQPDYAQSPTLPPVLRLAAANSTKTGRKLGRGAGLMISSDAVSTHISRGRAKLTRMVSAKSACPRLLVMRGDPTDWSTAAIVNDANSMLRHDCGLGRRLFAKEVLRFNVRALLGSTTTEKFASGPQCGQLRASFRATSLSTQSVPIALNVADNLGVTSVTIPAISTGPARYPKYLAAREIVSECLQFCDDNLSTTLRLIVLMNEEEVTTSILSQAMKEEKKQRQMLRQGSSIVDVSDAHTHYV
ncbi:unnamed protein product [Phytophthora lilii]|uniref:Unnamed protein product n=1 Tax=Phytophthora lilii TaxID=2077276 RepID=A0A9W6U780_9STRA|nr:unnamed protein product [Phytophthora lilii]